MCNYSWSLHLDCIPSIVFIPGNRFLESLRHNISSTRSQVVEIHTNNKWYLCLSYIWVCSKKRVVSAHTASGYIFQKVHSWIWRPLPKWETQPMWPWRWVMASLCANISRLVFANLVTSVGRSTWKKLVKSRTATRHALWDTQSLANTLPRTSSASLVNPAAMIIAALFLSKVNFRNR